MPRRNIGVAVEVPAPHGPELQAWRQRLGDPAALRIPPHVTLLPPTGVRDIDLTIVENHLRAIAGDERPFRIHLRGTGTFRPVSPVTFVQVAAGLADCERLERRIRSGPLERKIKFNYHPHVTVAQDVPEAALEEGFRALSSYDVEFDVWGFTLFEEDSEKVWHPLLDFPFGRELPGPPVGHPAPRLDD